MRTRKTKNSPTQRTEKDLGRAAAILGVVALAIIAFIAFRPSPAPQPASPEINRVWFDDLLGIPRLTRAEELQAAEFIFSSIIDRSNVMDETSLDDNHPRILFLSLSDGSSKAKVIFQGGTTLKEAADGLILQARALTETGYAPIWLKLDFVNDSVLFEDIDPSQPSNLDASLYGLAFEASSGIALLPEELLANAIIDSEQQLQPSNLLRYFEESGRIAAYAKGLDAMPSADVFRFAATSYFYEDGQPLLLYRGHRVFPVYTNLDLQKSLEGAARYLINAVGEDGRFVYAYYPITDSISQGYNILRHAGTTYAMLDLYSHNGDPALLASAERAINYLMSQVRRCPVGGSFENCLVEDDRAKLGGNGLAVLALSYYMRVTGNQALLPETQSLARWMASLQAESGEFTTHTMEFSTGRDTGTVSAYYPGEAIYALANLYLVDGDENWLRAAQNGARWLAADRIEGKAPSDITHDHWLLLGLDVIQHISPDPVYYEAAMTIADAIIQSQNMQPEFPDWFGSFYKPPRSTPAATRTEGLMAAYRVARDYGTPEDAERILQAAQASVSFQLATQFYPESAMYLPNPQRVLGGFHADLTNFEIRNDYVQHNLSAILALLRALE